MLGLLVLAVAAAPALAGSPDYDLRANLPLAHVQRAGVVADATSPGFIRYTRDEGDRWKTGVTIDGRPAALNPGIQANLWIPIGPELAGKKAVIEALIRPFPDKPKVDVFFEGEKVGSPDLKAGAWQIIRVEIPEAKVKEGLAKVRLHFNKSEMQGNQKTATAIRFVRLAEASAPAAPEAEADVAGALKSADGDAIVLPDAAGLDYYVSPAAGMRLSAKAEGGQLEVLAQLDGEKPKALGAGASVDIGLDAYAGKGTRLMLRGKGGTAKVTGKITGGTLGSVTVKKPKYVIFWLIDTLRADKLGFYPQKNANGRPKVKTPNVDKIAGEGVVFDPYYVEGTESKASHASFFTSTYPVTHGVYTHEANLKSEHTTIAEAFKAAGFRTAGFIANGYVSDRWNYNQGFDDYQNFIRDETANNAAHVVKTAKPWITKNKDKPFYLYLGTNDPHVTYRVHDEFIGDYDKGAYNGSYKKYLSGTELGRLKEKKSPPSERDRQRIEAIYENEIAFNDKHFGDLLDHLKAEGIYDETAIIISADHGDEFWEHGSCGHGHNLHQELVRVPLVIKMPGFPAGARVTSGANGVDILPTLLTVIGGEAPKDGQGMSLVPSIGGKSLYPQAQIAMNGTSAYALAVGNAKVIYRSDSSIMAFDIAKDIAEKTDVFDSKPVLTLTALDPLLLFLSKPKTWKKEVMGPPNNLTRAFK
ncbi:MAG: sulfatase [bacterium]